jgi:hypothetical protein
MSVNVEEIFEDDADPPGDLMRAVVSKRGVDDGNQKGGGFLQPAQESQIYYKSKNSKRKKNFQIFFFHKKSANSFLTLSGNFYMT